VLKELLRPEINDLIQANNWRELKEVLSMWPAPDIADLIKDLENKEFFILFRLLSRELAAEVFSELDYDSQARLLDEIGDENVLKIVASLSPDDRTEFFEELPGRITQTILNRLPPDVRKESLQLLGYPDNSVGRRMTPDYVAIKPGWTVKNAIASIRKNAKKAETVNIVYVTDKNSKLIDEVSLSSLVIASPVSKIESLMDEKVISISASAHEEEAARIMKRYDLIVLPVVDSDNILLGVITIDDVIDVIDMAVSEDLQKTASVMPFETQYSSANYMTLFKKRIVWLIFFGVGGFFAGSIISFFEDTLGKFVALAFFIPALIGTGGNTAIQSSTLIIRAIALEDVSPGKWLAVMKKEILVGVLLGAVLSAVLFAMSYLWMENLLMSAVIGCSVIFITLWANILGSMLPLILTKFRLDPAVVSSPMLTTVIDVTGLMIYFIIAGIILKTAL